MQQWSHCPKCNAVVAFGAKFCGNCGFQLNWDNQQPLPPQYQYAQQPVQWLGNKPQKRTMRITAGILMIIGGFVGNFLLIGVLYEQGLPTLQELGILGIIFFLPALLTLIGGVMALRRVYYKWALAGAICSLLSPIFGIPALILLIKSKGEFSR